MLQCITVLYASFMASIVISITNEEIKVDALVRFHWSESNKERNNTDDVRRRAQALDGQLATIMNPPFWSKNPKRIVIQSLDDPDLILAVKLRNLESVEPIKIHLLHAKNDISTSDEYLEKEKRVLSTNNYTAALLSVHPDNASGVGTWGCCIGSCAFSEELSWYSLPLLTPEDLTPPRIEHTVNRLKASIKSFLSRLLYVDYRFAGSSVVDEVNGLRGYDERFKNILRVQLTKTVRHNDTYQDMEWLRNDLIDWKWMVQGMYMIHLGIQSRMQMMAEQMLAPVTLPAQSTLPMLMLSVIDPLIVRTIQDIANQTKEQYGPSSPHFLDEELFSSMFRNCHPTPSLLGPGVAGMQQKLLLLGFRKLSNHVVEHVRSIQEMAMIRTIGTTMAAVHRFVSQESLEGSSIAIVIPGDLIPNVDRLEHLLYRIIKKLGWKYKCELEVFEI